MVESSISLPRRGLQTSNREAWRWQRQQAKRAGRRGGFWLGAGICFTQANRAAAVASPKAAGGGGRAVFAARRTKAIDQLKRLLFDEMRHVSKQGLAAYPDDVMRDMAYRLERLGSKDKRAKKTPEVPVTPDELKSPDVAA